MAIGFNKNGLNTDNVENTDQEVVDSLDKNDEKKKIDPKIIVIVAAVLAAIVFIIVIKTVFVSKDTVKEATSDVSSEQMQSSEQNSDSSADYTEDDDSSGYVEGDTSSDDYVYDSEMMTPTPSPELSEYVKGEPDYEESTNNTTTAKVFSANDFVKDLDGNNVPAIYNVDHREYIDAHVSYTAKRAIIDDGMELYWIDVDYKGKKYRVQVPFYYFKDFSDSGICKVNIEVLYLESGGQVISYMQVVDEDSED